MALAAQKHASDPRIKQILVQQKAIEKYIRNLVAEIERIDDGRIGNFWAIKAETREFTTYKAILEERVRNLRRQLAALRRQRQELRLALIQSNARKIRKKNRLAARRMLRKAEKRGELTKDEEDKLARYTEGTLRAALGALNSRPSRGNMRLVLDAMADVMLVGGSDAACQEAFAQLAEASRKRRGRIEREFRANATKANFKKLMDSVAEGMLFGDDSSEWPPRPEGLNLNWPEKQHHVQPGDTLASISEKYYGSPGYWEQIYLVNFGVIGDNIDRLRPHIVLRVPGNRR